MSDSRERAARELAEKIGLEFNTCPNQRQIHDAFNLLWKYALGAESQIAELTRNAQIEADSWSEGYEHDQCIITGLRVELEQAREALRTIRSEHLKDREYLHGNGCEICNVLENLALSRKENKDGE